MVSLPVSEGPLNTDLEAEGLILAVWLISLFDIKLLRRSTQHIAPSIAEKRRENVLHLLESVYNIREIEQGYKDEEHGNCS